MSDSTLNVPEGRDHRLFDWLRGTRAGLVPLALLVGAGAGGGAVLFRYLIIWVTEAATGRSDYSNAGHVASPHFPGLGIYFVILVPVIGGLVYGPLIDRYAKEARGHGVPEVMLAIAERGGRIGPAVAVVKSLASAICIGVGGSVGREGPIVQIGSALGSTIGQRLKAPETRLRLLVACGAAGGISATFNAPIAGVFFALELILRDFQTESFGVVALSSVTADVIGRAVFGSHPFLALPGFHLVSGYEYPLYALLGVVAAVVGVGFIKVLYGMEDLFDRFWPGPEWLRPATGGVLLGLLLLVLPEMYGVGYPVLEGGIRGHYSGGFLLLLLVGKLVAVSLTIAIGGSGGVFAPSLFMGAMLGTAFGDLAGHLLPGLTGSPGTYGLIGMGAVFAGAARAPITAVLIIFELTGDYTVILPLMTAIVLAAGVSNLISSETIYTLKLRRRGIDILRGRAANLMQVLRVADAMVDVPDAVPMECPLNEIIARFANEGLDALPVVDTRGAYRGTITAGELERSAQDNLLDVTAGELARTTPTLRTDQTLEDALGVLVSKERSGLPVLSVNGRQVTGWITHRDVLRAYNERLHQSVAAAETKTQPTGAPPTPDTPAGPVTPSSAYTEQRSLARLQGYRIIDLELNHDRPPVGQRVADLNLPPSSLLLAVRRDGSSFTAEEDTVLRRGDRISVVVPADHAHQLTSLIEGLTLPSGPDRDMPT
ncbi:MAG: chloride channel protein [Acidimicrobiales bacterium]